MVHLSLPSVPFSDHLLDKYPNLAAAILKSFAGAARVRTRRRGDDLLDAIF